MRPMPIRTVAAILIGQAPREDLVEELAALLPEDVELRQVGALDPVEPEQIPPLAPDAAYPLTTQLEDTTPVIVDERWITPYLQSAVDRAHTEGAGLGVILCAAPFASVRSTMPLVRPFEVAREHVARLGARRLLVVVPADDQVEAARAKWSATGASAEVLVARLAEGVEPVVEAAAESEVDAVVLDFVGHPPDVVLELEDALEAETDAHLVDLGRVAAQRVADLAAEDPASGGSGG